MKYRPEIDGLRAIAVLPVILFHAGFNLFSGGFVGVDVFFVISGYLITTILLDELETGDFSLRNFYERRCRRILPALFFVMLCTIPFAGLWMFPDQLRAYAKSLIAVSFSVSNMLFMNETGYFAEASAQKPLLHTWSLAVEEQFYIIFPLFLMGVWRFGKRNLFWMLLALATGSLFLCEWAVRVAPEKAFYLAPTRAWELLAGSFCAFLILRKGIQTNNVLAFIGLLAITVSIFAFDESLPFPGLYAMLPVAGVVLIILFGDKRTFVGKLLGTTPLVSVGLISYSAYLWHQPLFAFAHIRSLHEPSFVLMSSLAILTLALAYLTWRFVEQPFRKSSGTFINTRSRVFAASAVGILFFTVVGATAYTKDGFPKRFEKSVTRALEARADRSDKACYHNENSRSTKFTKPACQHLVSTATRRVMVLGDSHSNSISKALVETLNKKGISVYRASHAMCIPLPGFRHLNKGQNHRCANFVDEALTFADASDIDTIVLTARFAAYYKGIRFDNTEGGREAGERIPVDDLEHPFSDWNEAARQSRVLTKYSKEVLQLARRFNVVLVAPVPEAGWHVPDQLAKRRLFATHEQNDLSTSFDLYKKRSAEVLTLFKELSDGSDKIRVAEVQRAFCDNETNRCVNAREDLIYYLDSHHLTKTGAKAIAPIIADTVTLLPSEAKLSKP